MELFHFFLFVIGLSFGSFFAAFSYRIPNGISIIKGRSFCPRCKNPIKWFDNIPLISYLFLGGVCRHCRKRISSRYIFIELATGLTFYLVSFVAVDPVLLLFLLFIASILILIFIIDLEHQIIPDGLVFAAFLVTLAKVLVFDNRFFFEAVFSGFLAALFLLLVHLFTKGRGMGLGDVKFAVFGGMFIGLRLLPIWLFVSFLSGAIVGIILILFKFSKLKDKIAFGPFLIAGLVATYFWGHTIYSYLFLLR